MKIAVTVENGMIFQHFGKSSAFAVYEVEGNRVISKALVSAGQNQHSALVGQLREMGADLLICGGIGGGAKDALNHAGIGFVSGASGDADAAVEAYLAGTLKDNPAAQCSHHGASHVCH